MLNDQLSDRPLAYTVKPGDQIAGHEVAICLVSGGPDAEMRHRAGDACIHSVLITGFP
jgi:hypothetical protein